ncbi:MAG: sugar ABC transporter ATP-binding protein [Solirubrobacterales bacterium]
MNAISPSSHNSRLAGAAPALRIENLSKSFQGVLALNQVDLELCPGEVHALLGQNGSGKSTLIKVLAGFQRPERGAKAWVDGEPFKLGEPGAAHAASLRFIHQDLALIGELNAVDNLALGESYGSRIWLSDGRERKRAEEIFDRYEVDIDVSAPVISLTRAEQTMTAIVRALYHQTSAAGILVLDEPTAAFADHEVQRLFELIHRVQVNHGTVLYVTHRLEEVFQLADRVTVLRDGKKVTTRPVAGLDHDSLAELIVGRPVDTLYPQRRQSPRETAITVTGLSGGHVARFDLELHKGELVGVTGLKDSGANDVLHRMFGSRPRHAGELRLASGELFGRSPASAIKAGVAFAPADRRALSGMLEWTLRENVTLPKIKSRSLLRWIGAAEEREDARAWLQALGVVPADPEAHFSELSGGNQQKVVLARWLRCKASIFLIEEPTGGVDVGARQTIYEALRKMTADGGAVLISSSDAEELAALCDRVIVMRRGRITATLEGAAQSADNISLETIREEA